MANYRLDDISDYIITKQKYKSNQFLTRRVCNVLYKILHINKNG